MKLHVEGITIDAISLAGFYTCIQLPDFKIALDMGICPRSAINKQHVFFTHCHGDHIAGVVRHCSSREMLGLPPPTYYIGSEDVEHFKSFIDAARKLCRSRMPYFVHEIKPNQQVDIRKDIRVKSFRSIHRVPCQGYTIYGVKQKLRTELLGNSREELISRRQSGEILTVDVETPLISYTGDTTIDLFQKEQQLQQVKVLITEVTFFDDKVDAAAAKTRGHIHIDDIVRQANLFTQPAIVFTHFSSRYSTSIVEQICKKKLPSDLYQRIHLIPNDQPLVGF
jgi:ribonuclease Z